MVVVVLERDWIAGYRNGAEAQHCRHRWVLDNTRHLIKPRLPEQPTIEIIYHDKVVESNFECFELV
jgi:hypothetical protein